MDSRQEDEPAGTEPGLGTHTDERGVIRDLLGRTDGITEIITVQGAVRGNHVHARTDQWTYVVSGFLQAAWLAPDGTVTHRAYRPGQWFAEPAGVPHAWKALEDTTVLVFTRGPRAGEAYETDTQRLPKPDWLLA